MFERNARLFSNKTINYNKTQLKLTYNTSNYSKNIEN